MAPHPMGSPFDNGFVCIVRPFASLKNGPPCLPQDGWPHPFVGGATHRLNRLKPFTEKLNQLLSVAENRRHKVNFPEITVTVTVLKFG